MKISEMGRGVVPYTDNNSCVDREIWAAGSNLFFFLSLYRLLPLIMYLKKSKKYLKALIFGNVYNVIDSHVRLCYTVSHRVPSVSDLSFFLLSL